MKFVPNAVSRKAALTVLKTQKHSPTILFAAGVVGVVGSTVLACRATLRVEAVLEEISADIHLVQNTNHEKYGEDDRKKDLALVYFQGSVKLAKLYGPAFVLGVTSIACLTKSHNILTKRNAALTAAYAVVEKSFGEYRDRVKKELGEDKDREFMFGSETREIAVETDKGIKVEKVKVATSTSMYARFFDFANPNWQSRAELNETFLRCHEQYANEKLASRGHVFLNEIYDALGFERTPYGQIVGWKYDSSNGDQYIDFGWKLNGAQFGGEKGSILLDFNVDGPIYELI